MTLLRLSFALITAFSLTVPALRAQTLEQLSEREVKVQAVAKKVMGSIVAIMSKDPKKPGSGSGIIVQKDGLILTAAHVTAATGDDLVIVFPDGHRVNGKALGANRGTDAGLAKITDPGDWPAVDMGSSDKMRLGDWCVAMGHPGGFSYERRPPVRLGRIWRRDSDGAIWTDCPLIGGDSGGPLFDLEGRVIGINSSIHGAANMNRHVAVDTLREDWDKMMKEKAWGVQVFQPDQDRPRVGAIFDRESQEGVKVEEVPEDGPASKAGIKAGDLVVKFDGVDVATYHHMQRLIGKKKPGDKVKIQVRRGKETVDTELELAKPPSMARRQRNAEKGKDNDDDDEKDKGPSEPNIPEEKGPRPFFGAEIESTGGKGAKVTSVKPNSPAAKAGLVAGDIILRLNDKDVDGPTPASEIIRALKPGDKISIKSKRGETEMSADATLDKKS
ncbi:MAG TPA: PDZ domain-containing protein [Verrucomicrobiales bacterium]|nr:PDZ domain-containing protein [Verrucomicrobiales bacterium]